MQKHLALRLGASGMKLQEIARELNTTHATISITVRGKLERQGEAAEWGMWEAMAWDSPLQRPAHAKGRLAGVDLFADSVLADPPNYTSGSQLAFGSGVHSPMRRYVAPHTGEFAHKLGS
jgi:hypothetical protein